MAPNDPKSKRIWPAYIITGKSASSVSAACERLLDELLPQQQRMTGLFTTDTSRTTMSEVLDELRTLPFLTDRRVVLVKNAEDFIYYRHEDNDKAKEKQKDKKKIQPPSNAELLEKYLANPCATGALIMTVETWDGRTKFAKKFPQLGQLISVAPLKGAQLSSDLAQYTAEKHNKTLAPQAASLLAELVGNDAPFLYNEIDKLALFVDSEKIITAEHIEKLVGRSRLFGTFEVIDTVLSGDTSKAITKLREMFLNDRSAEFTFIGAFAYLIRKMFNAKAMLDKGEKPYYIAEKLNIWSNKEAIFSQLRKVKLETLGSTLQHLADIDYAVKTGQTNVTVAAEQLVLRLANG